MTRSKTQTTALQLDDDIAAIYLRILVFAGQTNSHFLVHHSRGLSAIRKEVRKHIHADDLSEEEV